MEFRTVPGITDNRENTISVDVWLVNEHGSGLWIYSSGLTTDEAIGRAEQEVGARFGGEWTYNDWRAA